MTSSSIAETSSGTQAVDRAAALLTHVIEADAPVTFAELSESAGLARSTTSRLMAALERTRLVERVATGEYVGGPLFVLYAARHDRNAQLARLARPMLELVGERTGESVHLAVPNGGGVEHIDQVDTTFLLGARDWTEVVVPDHCSALGKVMLAWRAFAMPTGRLEAPTELSLRTAAALVEDLRITRERGYAITCDELELGLAGVAAPVFGGGDRVVAAIGVSGPTARLADRTHEVGRLLTDQAEALTTLLRHGTQKEGVA